MTASENGPADGVQRYAELAAGLTRSTLDVTERALAHFVRQGEVAAEHAERIVEDVIARSVESSGALTRLVRAEVERAVARAGFVRASELEALQREVRRLRERSAGTDAPAPVDDRPIEHGDDVEVPS
jgi:polyhydroxyalkanoate synthesis regulator phasin